MADAIEKLKCKQCEHYTAGDYCAHYLDHIWSLYKDLPVIDKAGNRKCEGYTLAACPYCDGSGLLQGFVIDECFYCNGTGKVEK